MAKKDYDDPAKQKWREAWFQFIKKNKNFLRGSPNSWNVAFFPSEKALELNVYDRIKIPRENLLGLEKDPRIYEKLRKKDLGFRLTKEPMDAFDFFKTTDEKFDIINLDYESYLTKDIAETLRNIAGKQLLEETSLFGITIYGKREKESNLDIYKLSLTLNEVFASQENFNLFMKLDDYGEFLKEIGYHNKRKLKDIGLTKVVIGHMVEGLGNLTINPLFRNSLEIESSIKAIEAELQKHPEYIKEEAVGLLNSLLRPNLSSYLNEIGVTPISSSNIALLTNWYQNRPYLPWEADRMEYVSRRGSLMLSDFFRLSQERKFLNKYKYIADHAFRDLNIIGFFLEILGLGKDSESHLSICKNCQKKASKIIKKDVKFGSVFNNLLICENLGSRIFLGSSAKLPKLTGKEYYQQRYKDDEKGISVEETHDRLIETFKVTRGQLPRFESHYTMETHGPKYTPEKPDEETIITEEPDELETAPITDKSQLITFRGWRRLSENKRKRLEYFINEDLKRLNLNEEQLTQFAQNIYGSGWYNENNDVTDSQFYAFFDDLLLESINKDIPHSRAISMLYENIRRPNWKKNYPRTVKPLLTFNEYKRLRIGEGKSDEWISRNYRTKKPNSIRAYKAWINIHNKKKMANQVKSPLDIYVDSHGIVHKNPSNIADIENGYK